jgi:hypothetical protein
VRAHQAVRVAAPIEKVDGRAQELKEVEAVEVVDKERDAEVGPSRGMEKSVVELATWKSWHSASTVALPPPHS